MNAELHPMFGKIAKRGWWKANVDPALNAEQVQTLLERDAPWHPALNWVKTCVRGFLAARGRRTEYRCVRCLDSTWIHVRDTTTREGTKTAHAVFRCTGANGSCPQDAWVLARKRERTAEAKASASATGDSFE